MNTKEIHQLQNERVACGFGDSSVKREIRIDAIAAVPDIRGDCHEAIGYLAKIDVAPSGGGVTGGVSFEKSRRNSKTCASCALSPSSSSRLKRNEPAGRVLTTYAPLPRRASTRPSCFNREIASLTTARLTPIVRASSNSVGNRWPSG